MASSSPESALGTVLARTKRPLLVLRDHLAVLAEGADARISALMAEQSNAVRSRAIVQSSIELTRILQKIEAQERDNRIRILDVGTDYLDRMSKSFIHLGLSESQENLAGQTGRFSRELNFYDSVTLLYP